MSELETVKVERTMSPNAILGTIGLALAMGLGSLIWCFGLHNHMDAAEQQLKASNQTNAELQQKLAATDARLRATTETLAQSVGLTQKQMEAKTQSIIASQNIATAKLEQEEAATNKQVGTVSSDVASVKTDVGSVKTDVGGVKTDVAATKTDLESTKSQLNRVMGDAGVMSGLIATNHGELEELKHRGDRNYFEFTLNKGAQPALISTIKLQLKKVDTKRSKFTLDVSSDDKNIEKKDKNLDEPVQFYSGKTPMLFEIVVNSINKNQISGYLSTPKNAPQPMAAP